MKKLLTSIIAICAISGSVCETLALTRYTTYDRFGNKTGSVRSIVPGIVTRYDANGNKIGTYVNNRAYNSYRYPSSTYIPTNRVMNRTYYYNNTYNPYRYRYNTATGGLKSYNRFGQRVW